MAEILEGIYGEKRLEEIGLQNETRMRVWFKDASLVNGYWLNSEGKIFAQLNDYPELEGLAHTKYIIEERMMKHAPRIITRGKYAYQVAGHFSNRFEAEQYKHQTLHSLLVVSDEPRIWGVGVRYHVYRRLN